MPGRATTMEGSRSRWGLPAPVPYSVVARGNFSFCFFFFSSRRRHTRLVSDWSSDVCSSDLLLRRTAIDWLTATLTALAGEANRKGAGIQIERQDSHTFHRDSATMVGTQLTLRRGVRALAVESGWPRKPADGFLPSSLSHGGKCASLDRKSTRLNSSH